MSGLISVMRQKLPLYIRLMRADKPIGTWLLLWPTLWALWIASEGVPTPQLLLIFTLGVFLTRSAGCVINDYADRHIDGHVKRTADRPLATGQVSEREALALFVGLMLSAFVLVLFTNRLTIQLSVIGVALAFCYPFMKRYTHYPQVVLGAAFGWAIPMAFTAVTGTLPLIAWLLYLAKLLWTVAYDTQYAMVDRDDDLKIGVKSTAIRFGQADKLIIGLLQGLAMLLLLIIGLYLDMSFWYYSGLIAAIGFFGWQQYLIRQRERAPCFQAFLNNHLAELAVLIGIVLHYAA
ncbi:4-hydroxybenzoate polyprenyltransferase [Nitrincola lacisaponensis]|uniref:4-hydroxybenzoate octaprenyltransferase n=1 Tax=Nitrincola lacisaponensis TaxID=267850 RepID=A0A063Y2P2_9GAMM|nr:4-hydroxybenzoate octaprenyltransferase [Nitrincola lacisaponensis]KDE38802.1 4-hydroxybenzoate polyprenyltransferase [Nitrincola lacisaponensis]